MHSILFLLFFSIIGFSRLLFSEVIPDNAFTKEARGSSIFNILKSPVSPRFFSMGGVGITEYGSDSVFYNPAGAFTDNSDSFYVDFQTEVSDSKRSDFSYLKREEYKSYGILGSYMDYGDFIKIDNSGSIKGYFSPKDLIIGLTYSYGESDRFGLTVKYINSDMVYYTANAIAFDGGFILKGNKTRYSFLLRNLGFGAKIQGKTYPLPLELIAGAKYFYSRVLNGVFELHMPSDDQVYAAGGFEYLFANSGDINLYLRGGMNLKNKTPLGWSGVFSGGFGVNIGDFLIDYAFVPYSNIEAVHKISLRFSYGKPDFKKKEKKNFESFVSKQIAMKKKIVVFDFNSDMGEEYGKLVSNAVEERLIEKKYVLISKLDPIYISLGNKSVKNAQDAIKNSKNMGADFAVWGESYKINDEKANFKFFLVNVLTGDVFEFNMVSNIYDIRNISLKLSDEISKNIN